MIFSSGLKATLRIPFEKPSIFPHFPDWQLRKKILWSVSETRATALLFMLKDTASPFGRESEPGRSLLISLPVRTSHSRTGSLPQAAASNLPSGLKATETALKGRNPSNWRIRRPEIGSHKFTRLTSPLDASIRPLGLNATEF